MTLPVTEVVMFWRSCYACNFSTLCSLSGLKEVISYSYILLSRYKPGMVFLVRPLSTLGYLIKGNIPGNIRLFLFVDVVCSVFEMFAYVMLFSLWFFKLQRIMDSVRFLLISSLKEAGI